MLTETISGKCPCCGYDKLLQRYGSHGYYQLDGCAKCGFGYGTNGYGETADNKVGFESWAGYGLYVTAMFRASSDVPYPEELRNRGSIDCQKDEDYLKYSKDFDDSYKKHMDELEKLGPEEQRFEIFKRLESIERSDDLDSTVFSYEESEIEEHKSKNLQVFQ
jgi:hypothetical protein